MPCLRQLHGGLGKRLLTFLLFVVGFNGQVGRTELRSVRLGGCACVFSMNGHALVGGRARRTCSGGKLVEGEGICR